MHTGKTLKFVFLLLSVYTVRSSWLGDVFNGLDETSVGDSNEEPMEFSNDISHDGSPAQAIIAAMVEEARNIRHVLRKSFKQFVPREKRKEFSKMLNKFIIKLFTERNERRLENIFKSFHNQLKELLKDEEVNENELNKKDDILVKLFEKTLKEKREKNIMGQKKGSPSQSTFVDGLNGFKASFYKYFNNSGERKIQEWVRKFFVKPHSKNNDRIKKFLETEKKNQKNRKGAPWNNKLESLFKERNRNDTQSMRPESSIIMKEKTVANEPKAQYKPTITSVQNQFRKNVPKEEKEREKKLLQETENLLKNTRTAEPFHKLLPLTKQQAMKVITNNKDSAKKNEATNPPEVEDQNDEKVIIVDAIPKWDTNGVKGKADSVSKYDQAARDLQWVKRKDNAVQFSRHLKAQAYNWFDVTNKAYQQMDMIKQYFKKKGF